MNKKIFFGTAAFLTLAAMATTAFASELSSGLRISDGSLIRGGDHKVFVVRDGARELVRNLTDLRRFSGRPIINVDDNTLRQFRTVSGRTNNSGPGSANSSRRLVRSSDGRIFFVRDGVRTPVRTITELRREHAGLAIQNLSFAELNRIPLAAVKSIDDSHSGLEVETEHGVTFLKPHGGTTVSGRLSDDGLPRHSGLDDSRRLIGSFGSVRIGDDNLPRHSGVDNISGRRGGSGGGSLDD